LRSNRNARLGKIKQALTQAPANAPLPKRPLDVPRPWRQPQVPHEIPVEPKLPVDFRDPSRLPHVAPLARGEGFAVQLPLTQVLPVVDLAATQPLPVVRDLPPSAQHADPARWYERLVVEDESADSLAQPSHGRHVLDALRAADSNIPDLVGHDEPAPTVQGNYRRVVAALAPPDTLAGAVRIARRAHAMFVVRNRRLVEDESRLEACHRRIAEFNADWDRQLRDAEIARHGQRAVVAAENLTAAYEANRRRVAEENARRAADGRPPLDATATTFTRGMAARIQQMLVDEAKAGSVGVR
jgi:hypothetical protein